MPDLLSGQFAIGDLLLGRGTPYIVSSFDPGSPDFTSGDVNLAGEDGTISGRDTIAGPVFAIEMTVDCQSPSDGRQKWQALQSSWRNPALRASPFSVTTFAAMYQSDVPVVAFGRPRKLDLADGTFLRVGRVDLQAEFQASDWRWYSAEEKTLTLSLIPSDFGSGITWPVTWPVTWGTYSESLADVVQNEGPSDTWPVITFKGPVVNPQLTIVGSNLTIGYSGQLLSDQSITLDTRPWARSALNQSGGSVAGSLTGNRLGEFILPSGPTVMKFQGTDATGTSRCEIRYRDAFPTL